MPRKKEISEHSDFSSEDQLVENQSIEEQPQITTDNIKSIKRLKKKINNWMDYDDKIKLINLNAKKLKEAKKNEEIKILKIIDAMEKNSKQSGMKIDVTDSHNKTRGRVYRYKTITKESLKEDIVKDALMEHLGDERRVQHLLAKIDKKRPIKERYYLKRTKGSTKD